MGSTSEVISSKAEPGGLETVLQFYRQAVVAARTAVGNDFHAAGQHVFGQTTDVLVRCDHPVFDRDIFSGGADEIQDVTAVVGVAAFIVGDDVHVAMVIKQIVAVMATHANAVDVLDLQSRQQISVNHVFDGHITGSAVGQRDVVVGGRAIENESVGAAVESDIRRGDQRERSVARIVVQVHRAGERSRVGGCTVREFDLVVAGCTFDIDGVTIGLL